MRKNGAVFLLLAATLIAHRGYAAPPPRQEQGIVFTGVAGRMATRNSSIEKALEDAARKAAFYHSVGGIIIDLDVSGFGFFTESSLFYDEDYTKYIGDLQFDPAAGVIEEGDVFMVRAVYAAAPPPRIDYVKPSGNSRPPWVDNPPAELNGYQAVSAAAGRQSTAAKTAIASYENAVYGLLRNNSVSVTTRQITENGALVSVSSYVSSGTVRGFYVVDFWTDPETKAVWTLAVAREIIGDTIDE